MIVLGKGMRGSCRQWPQYKDLPQAEVEAKIREEFPGVEFKVFTPEMYQMICEEFYYQRIALVVDNGVVVEIPKFFGAEPKLDLIENSLGQEYTGVYATIKNEIPDVKVVAENEGQKIFESSAAAISYILLKVDACNKVKEVPTYVRVLPTHNP